MQKTLGLFQKTNTLLNEYDEEFADVYSELRDCFIKLFETIFNKAQLFAALKDTKSGKVTNDTLLFKENELLKARVQHMASSSPRNYSPKAVGNNRGATPKRSPSPNATNEAKLLALSGNLSKSSDKGSLGGTQTASAANLANTRGWKRENSFLKAFTKAEAGNSLKDIMFKPFSEQNLVDFIRELVSLKKSHDLKCREGGFPRETMEPFMYGYLKKKYGLQPVVVERVMSITMAIQDFSEANNEVAAFGLVR